MEDKDNGNIIGIVGTPHFPNGILKSEIVRQSMLEGKQVVIIDSLGEYSELIRELDADVIAVKSIEDISNAGPDWKIRYHKYSAKGEVKHGKENHPAYGRTARKIKRNNKRNR